MNREFRLSREISIRILVIGYNALDVTFPYEGHPVFDSKSEVPFIQIGGGGPGANAAIALARLGAEVRLITPLTDDPGGLMQKAELVQAGVDIDLSPVFCGHKIARAVIMVNPANAERVIFWSRGQLPLLDSDLWDDSLLSETDLLYFDGHEPLLSCMAAKRARLANIPIVFDAGSVREGSEELVAECSDVISSATFATDLAQTEDPFSALHQLRGRGPERVAMTFGPGGILALENDFFYVPAYEVEAVDSTGAGDVFHAGYAFATAQGSTFRERLEFAAATAAIKCQHWGGRGGLPSADDVIKFMDTASRLSPPERFSHL